MSSLFEDKRYEELDWISQAVEPIESELSNILGNLPDEFNIDFNAYMQIVGEYGGLTLQKRSTLTYLMKKYCGNTPVGFDDQKVLLDCFELRISSDATLDLEKSELYGEIKFIKIKNILEESDLKDLLGADGLREVSNLRHYNLETSRLNEILDMLGKCDEGLRSRSTKNKFNAIKKRLYDVFKTNEWNIKDMTLANKIGYWIAQYLDCGNLAALGNFAKLKVMTHRGVAIYSMEEIK